MLLEGAKFILIISQYKYKVADGALSRFVALCTNESVHVKDKIKEKLR